jgi:hypothetical protein
VKIKTHVDIAPLGYVLKQLSLITGKSFKKVLESEAGHILANATSGTKKAKLKNIAKQQLPQGWKFKRHTGGKLVTKYNGTNFHVGIPIRGDGNNGSKYIYPIKQWMRRNRWNEWVAEQEKKAKQKMELRGLAASQFYHMARILNLPLPKKPPKYIMKPALAKIVRPRIKSYKRGEKTKFEIMLQSRGLKVSKGTQAQRVLLMKVKGRITNMKNGLRKQLFDDIKWRTSRYPLLYK